MDPKEYTDREVYWLLHTLATEGGAWGVIIAGSGFYNLWRGASLGDGLLPVVAGIASAIALLVYAEIMPGFMSSGRKPTTRSFVANEAILLPWLLACFVVLYKGAWPLWSLRVSWDWWLIARSIVWMLIGYRLVMKTWLMTEIVEAHRTGKVVVVPNRQTSA